MEICDLVSMAYMLDSVTAIDCTCICDVLLILFPKNCFEAKRMNGMDLSQI